MKLIEREKLLVNQPGTVKIIPEERDDFWLLHQLIAPNDHVAAETSRKIHQSTGSGAAKKPTRVRFDMEVKITAVDYDKNSSVIRLKGKNITTNSYANGGAFHTLEIEKNKPFYLSKKSWDEVSIDSLREGCKRTSGADMAVVLIKEELALLYLVGRSVTDLCASIDGNRSNVTKFYEDVFHAFRKHVDFDIIRCVMIAGPGTTKNEFRGHLLSESKRLRLKSIEENKSQILVRNVCSVSKEGLREVLQDSGVMNLIKDTESAMKVRAMKELNELLSSNSDRACYGPKTVDVAHELMAIETLLITDDLFRSGDAVLRQKYIGLVDSVKKSEGKVLVFSSTHISGEKLAQLTGIAAILRFPLPDIEEMEL